MTSDSPVRHPIAEWAATTVLLLFGTTMLARAYTIPSGSMEGTLQIGDHVLVDKLAYAARPGALGRLLPYSEVKRGDIIVFRYPPDISQTYVKRCMGIPGDRIRIAGGRLRVNGQPVDEPYLGDAGGGQADFPAGGGELVVPEGRYFVLGDNRGNSADSRAWGLVPRSHIVGRPLLVYWSWDARRAASNFLAGPRWNRIFTLVR